MKGNYNKRKKNRIGKAEQLCWNCKKAVNGCAWSRDFEIIPGWDAELSIIRGYQTVANKQSFAIYDCPEFEED